MKGVARSNPASCRRRKRIGSSHIVVLVARAQFSARGRYPVKQNRIPLFGMANSEFRRHQPGVMHDDLGELGDLVLLAGAASGR